PRLASCAAAQRCETTPSVWGPARSLAVRLYRASSRWRSPTMGRPWLGRASCRGPAPAPSRSEACNPIRRCTRRARSRAATVTHKGTQTMQFTILIYEPDSDFALRSDPQKAEEYWGAWTAY